MTEDIEIKKTSILRHRLSPKKGNITFRPELEQIKLIANSNDMDTWLEQKIKTIFQPHIDICMSQEEFNRLLRIVQLKTLLGKKSWDTIERTVTLIDTQCQEFIKINPVDIRMVDFIMNAIKSKRKSPGKKRSKSPKTLLR
jgi:hypothetical protein